MDQQQYYPQMGWPMRNPFLPAYPQGAYPTAPQQPAQPAQPKIASQITGLWINDVSELDQYSVQQGVPLTGWFRNADVIVMRTVDETGNRHDRYIDYRERPEANQIDPANVATKEEVGALAKEIKDIRAMLSRGGAEDAAV
jgi:hypothetical protein